MQSITIKVDDVSFADELRKKLDEADHDILRLIIVIRPDGYEDCYVSTAMGTSYLASRKTHS